MIFYFGPIVSLFIFFFISVFLYYRFLDKSLISPIAILFLLILIHYVIHNILLITGIPVYFNLLNAAFVFEQNVYLFISVIILFLFYYSTTKLEFFLPKQEQSLKWSQHRLKIIFFTLFLTGWFFRLQIISSNSYFQISRAIQADGIPKNFYAFYMTAEQFPIHCLLIAFISYHLFKNQFWKFASGFSILAELIYWIPTGRKEEVVFIVIYPLMVGYFFKRKFPKFRTAFFTLLFIIVLFPLSAIYRNFFGEGLLLQNSLTVSDLVSIIFDSSNAAAAEYDSSSNEDSGSSFQRLNLSQEIAACIRISEDEGFKYGSDYLEGFVNLVPRFLWSSKPSYASGNDFGNQSGIISNDDITSISVTTLGEGFLNFGYLGVLPLAFFFIIMNWVYQNSFVKGYNLFYVFLYFLGLKSYMYIGGDFVGLFFTFLKLSVFYYLLFSLIKK